MTQFSAQIIQHRHHLNAEFQLAQIIYDIISAEFEEDGIPVSMFEVDEASRIWCVSIYAPGEFCDEYKSRMARAIDANNIDLEIDTQIIEQTDWVAKSLRQLSPVRAGRFLVHGSHDKDAVRCNDIAINIDAGLAFGTGHHGTTLGCLEMLERELKRRTFYHGLDLGTGSGVLAIALAKATKSPVLASDIDPVATGVARQNARLNRVANLVKPITAAGFNHRQIAAHAPYDLIVANILARPLQQMAVEFGRHLAPDATVILSGLLPHQKARIVAAFQIQLIRFVKAHIRDGWLTLILKS